MAADPEFDVVGPADATPTTPPVTGSSPVFSPRTGLDLIERYAAQAAKAEKSFFN